MIALITFLVLFLSLSSQAQVLGTIVDREQQPLSGCVVSLKGSGIENALTSNTFRISEDGTSIQRAVSDYSLNQFAFNISLIQPSNISLAVHNIAGRKMSSLPIQKLGVGNHSLELSSLVSSLSDGQPYILSVNVNGNRSFTTFIKENANILSGKDSHEEMASLKQANTSLDTLQITCDGYQPQSIALTSFNQDLGTISMLSLPNILVVFVDDVGYNDIGIYGALDPAIQTPNIDSLARQGILFTDWQSANAVCGPSRGSLLTGRLPPRNGYPVVSHDFSELQTAHLGLQPDQITIPEMLKPLGYKTAAFGKWHMGSAEKFLPLNHGFDRYKGVLTNFFRGRAPLPLHIGNTLSGDSITFRDAHSMITESTIEFMEESIQEDKPFMIYVSHYLAHGPWEPNREFATDTEWNEMLRVGGDINRIVYPALVREMDWHVGELMRKLDESGITDNTMVVFTSDNGPWLQNSDLRSAGSAHPLRGSKFNTWEGGHRVPGIIRYPDMITPGRVSDELVSTMDVFATVASVTGASIPEDYKIDGKNISSILKGEPGAQSPHDVLASYAGINLQTIRKGKWKLHLPRSPSWMPFYSTRHVGFETVDDLSSPELYNLEVDIGETNNVAETNPSVVADLLQEADKIRQKLGDWEVLGTERHNFDGFPVDKIHLNPHDL
jgi:arylsulfatase